MAPLIFGFTGALVSAYLAFSHEWPALTVLVFSGIGFAASYGLGLMLMASAVS